MSPSRRAAPFLRMTLDGAPVLVHYLRRPRSAAELRRLADLADEFAAGALTAQPRTGRLVLLALNARAEIMLGGAQLEMLEAEWARRSRVDTRSAVSRLEDAFVGAR